MESQASAGRTGRLSRALGFVGLDEGVPAYIAVVVLLMAVLFLLMSAGQ